MGGRTSWLGRSVLPQTAAWRRSSSHEQPQARHCEEVSGEPQAASVVECATGRGRQKSPPLRPTAVECEFVDILARLNCCCTGCWKVLSAAAAANQCCCCCHSVVILLHLGSSNRLRTTVDISSTLSSSPHHIYNKPAHARDAPYPQPSPSVRVSIKLSRNRRIASHRPLTSPALRSPPPFL